MIKKLASLIVVACLIIACSSDDNSNGGTNGDGFDRSALLAFTADNMIIPAFNDLQTKLSELDVARAGFVNDISESQLQNLSTAWLEAYKVWQHVEMFNIGEADNLGGGTFGFVSFFNIYPVTVSDIEMAASTGVYDLNSANYHDAQGFPALDFLIHGVATGDTNPIDKFTTNANASGYVTYLTDVVSQMISLNNRILNNWQTGFRDTFVANTENSANGSVNKLVNDYIFYYEKGFRANKIGIPAGNFSNEPLPEKVEAYYKNDVSKLLALEGISAIEKFFLGVSYNGNITGTGLTAYLNFLDKEELVTVITNQFTIARNAVVNLNASFSQQVETDNSQMTSAYDAIQVAVPLLKVDMAQAFNIVIDFIDADGD